jgi:ABC-2 type transport system permease protein
MNNFISLTKINLRQLIVTNFNVSKKDKKKRIITTALFSVLFLGLAVWIGYFGYQLGAPLQQIGMTKILILLAFVISSLMLLFQVLFISFNLIFKANDYDFLATLPIKQFTIIASKFVGLYLFCLFLSSIFFIPFSVIYFIFSGFSFIPFLLTLIGFLLMPAFPIAIGLILSFIINVITAKLPLKKTFIIIFSIGLTLLIMYFSQDFNSILNNIISNTESSSKIIGSIYYPAILITSTITNINLLNFLYFFLICTIPFILIIYLFSLKYKELNSFFSRSVKVKKVAYKVKISPVIFSIIKKELMRLFSSPLFFMNLAIGPLLLLVFGILSLTGSLSSVSPGLSNFSIALFFIPMCVLIISPTSATFSIEGKNFWLLKNLPIKFRDLVLGKILAYFIVFFCSGLLGVILLFFSLKLTLLEIVSVFLFFVFSIILSLLIGLVVNLHFYNLHWTNEVVVVKQSFSVLLSMIIGLILGTVPSLLIIILLIPYMSLLNWSWVLLGFFVLLTIILIIYIKKRGKSLFEKMI